MSPAPRKPANLDPRAVRLLEWLGAQPWANRIVLGGGVALKHYLDYRPTRDCDAWWDEAATAEERARALAEIARALERLNPGCTLRRDDWGEVNSLAVQEGGTVVFSFQIARRTRQLAPYLPSPWGCVQIETLEDNVASKMAALVDRGVGRDFLDIRQLHVRLGWSSERLWSVWEQKHPLRSVADAQAKARLKLEVLIRSRPLASIPEPDERAAAGAAREWFLNDFLCHVPSH